MGPPRTGRPGVSNLDQATTVNPAFISRDAAGRPPKYLRHGGIPFTDEPERSSAHASCRLSTASWAAPTEIVYLLGVAGGDGSTRPAASEVGTRVDSSSRVQRPAFWMVFISTGW